MRKNSPVKIIYIGNQLSVHGSTPTNIETLGPLLQEEGYKLYYGSSKKNMLPRLIDMLSRIVTKRKHADVVLIDTYSTNAFYYAWASAQLCRMLGIPYIPILHGGNLPQRIVASPGMSSQIFSHSFTNVAVSAYLQEVMQQKGFKNILLPNNIELGIYPFKHRSHIKPNLLWVRAFHKTYNATMAIRVLALLKETYPDATLTMVGPEKDGSMEACKALAKDMGVDASITFTGKLGKADWVNRSASHDVFINTTDFDNLPVSLLEAMALGLPIVTTNVGGIPYLVADGIDGILVKQGDEQEMAGAIVSLLQDGQKTAAISQAARRKAATFDWKEIKEKWDRLFESIPAN